MSGQMEWMLMFALGAGAAWLILRLFGIAPMVMFFGLWVGASAWAESYTITNMTTANVLSVGCGVYYYTDDFGNQVAQEGSTGWGGWCAGGDVVIPSHQWQTVSYDSTDMASTVLWFSGAEHRFNAGSWYYTVNADNAASHGVLVVGNPDGGGNGPFVNMDGEWLGGLAPSGVVPPDPSRPWMPQGGENDYTNVASVNTYGSLMSSNWIGSVNRRDWDAYGTLKSNTDTWGQMMSNQWRDVYGADGPFWTNVFNTNAGSATTWNPWLLGISSGFGFNGMTNFYVNYDPHQWSWYSRSSHWVKTAWSWAMVVGFIFLVREWLEDAMKTAWKLPPQGNTNSVGAFIGSLVKSSFWVAAMLAIPVAFTAWISNMSGLTTTEMTSPIALYQEDGTSWGLYARYAWSMILEWFPMDVFLLNCGYLIFVRFVLMPQFTAVQYVVIRILSCFVLMAALSGQGAVEFQYGASTPSWGAAPYGITNAWLDINGLDNDAWESVPLIIGGQMQEAGVMRLEDGSYELTWHRDLASTVADTGSLTNRRIFTDLAGTWFDVGRLEEKKLEVDGVQAFVEGFAMIIPMAALGWVRKMRFWASSAAQRIDL